MTAATTAPLRHVTDGSPRLRVVPLSFRQVCAYIAEFHRHHKPPRGGKVFLGVADADDWIVGVAVLGRPSARALDDGNCFEVTRACVEGLANANSCLYAAARKVGFAMGYYRGVTYLQAGESGASLRAAGWVKVKDLPARGSWAASSVKLKHVRDAVGTGGVARELWEVKRG